MREIHLSPDLTVLLDADLLQRARREVVSAAFGELLSRHQYAARRMARQVSGADEVEAVARAFDRVRGELAAGKIPDRPFRSHLFAAVRGEVARQDVLREPGGPSTGACPRNGSGRQPAAAYESWPDPGHCG